MAVIRFMNNRELRDLPDWAEQVSAMSAQQEGALMRAPEVLRRAVRDARIMLAVDVQVNKVVGCLIAWHLAEKWYEIGTLCVSEQYENMGFQIEDGDSRRDVGLREKLFSKMVTREPRLFLLTTTVEKHEIDIAQACGFVVAPFEQLASYVFMRTCEVCPPEKMQADHFASCQLRGSVCRLCVSPLANVELVRMKTMSASYRSRITDIDELGHNPC
ncbi:MAG: hypothetical protein ABIH21_04205 [Patescibacteria group bacterium]